MSDNEISSREGTWFEESDLTQKWRETKLIRNNYVQNIPGLICFQLNQK